MLYRAPSDYRDCASGLHLTLVEDQPVLPPTEIPDLVGKADRLRTDFAAYGIAIMSNPSVRRQLRAEIRAQFEAYRTTGLALDHVNAHRHYHLHPTVLSEILAIGRDYGMRAIRVPIEPMWLLRHVERTPRHLGSVISAALGRDDVETGQGGGIGHHGSPVRSELVRRDDGGADHRPHRKPPAGQNRNLYSSGNFRRL